MSSIASRKADKLQQDEGVVVSPVPSQPQNTPVPAHLHVGAEGPPTGGSETTLGKILISSFYPSAVHFHSHTLQYVYIRGSTVDSLHLWGALHLFKLLHDSIIMCDTS